MLDFKILPCIKKIAFNELKVKLHSELDFKGIYAIGVNENGGSGYGRIYIGSTTQNFKKRFRFHVWELKSNKHHAKGLQKIFNKYGEDSIFFQIIEVINRDIDYFNNLEEKAIVFQKEQYWIDLIGFKNLFNGAPVVNAHTRRSHSLEEKTKRSVSLKRAFAKPESQKRLSDARVKTWQDPDYRKKFSATWKDIWAQEGYSEKRGDILREAFKNSPDGRARLSSSSRRNWQNPEYRAILEKSIKERMASPESKKACSERTKKQWADKEHSENRIKTIAASTASKKPPCILVSPDYTMYVTDNISGFCKKYSLCQTGFAGLVRGAVQKYKGWTGCKLTSWADVPNDAIRVLWGDHPDLPPQTQGTQAIKPIQLTLVN